MSCIRQQTKKESSIVINGKKLSDKDEDCILMALYQYQLLVLGDKRMQSHLRRINKLISIITKDYPKV